MTDCSFEGINPAPADNGIDNNLNSSPSDYQEWEDSFSNSESDGYENDDGDATYDPDTLGGTGLPSGTDGDLRRMVDSGDAVLEPEEEGTSTGRRRYRHVNRVTKPRGTSKMRTRWKSNISTLTDLKIRSTKCCKVGRCFHNVDMDFFRERLNTILLSTAIERRRHLHSMKSSNGTFLFDGNQVCSTFLLQAFRFSRALQRAVKTETVCLAGSTSGEQESSAYSIGPTPMTSTDRAAPGRDAVVSYLERLADETGEKMPDRPERHLPFFRKREVYEHFVKEYRILHDGVPPVKSYFAWTWKLCCANIKVRKLSRFSKCSICEELREAMHEAVTKGATTQDLKRQKKLHIEMVALERREYKMKRDRAILRPDDFCSIIVDGADQSAFGLPHFITTTKQVRGHAMKVKLVGLLEHGKPNKLRLLTMTEEHETGANHIVEAIHRFLLDRARQCVLPRTLFIQLDNCTRENKNRYLLAYLEALIGWGVFDDVEAGFLPIGHTHEDIDQTFSRTSDRLRNHIAITLEDLHHQLRQTYNNNTCVTHMKHVANWSALCEQQRCLQRVTQFSQFRYFKFGRDAREATDGVPGVSSSIMTSCVVKIKVTEDWRVLTTPGGVLCKGFLKFLPDLSKIPHTVIKCPPGVEEVSKRFASEEGRINNTSKLIALHKIRDEVFSDRSDPCHWDLSEAVEYNLVRRLHIGEEGELTAIGEVCEDTDNVNIERLCNSTPAPSSHPSPVGTTGAQENPVSTPTSDYHYTMNSFVVVRPNEEEAGPRFWVGKVTAVHTNKKDIVTSLNVHWYQLNNSGDILQGRYFPSYLTRQSSATKQRKRSMKRSRQFSNPWIDKVDTDAIIVNFSGLTKRHCIPLDVRRQLT